MRIAMFSTKPYDRRSFEAANSGHDIVYLEPRLAQETVTLAAGAQAVCVFVNDDVSAPVLQALHAAGTRAVLLRCAGFNNVDLKAAGPGNLMAGLSTEAGGTASVSYTYIPATSATSADSVGTTGDYTVFDATTDLPGAATAQPYAGAADGPTQELLDHSGDNLAVSVTSDNWLIGTGDGNDVIVAHGGNNFLFGGGGSNWLVGAGGGDTFAVHAGGIDAWSTVGNFHAGDWLLVSGLSPQTAALSWLDGQGATGNTGLTLAATAADGSTTAVTLAHYFTTADLANGRLTTGFGGDPANGSGFFYIHANN